MLEKFLNKKVLICIAEYAKAIEKIAIGVQGSLEHCQRKGTITNINDKFIELDNDELIAIKYITTIKSI